MTRAAREGNTSPNGQSPRSDHASQEENKTSSEAVPLYLCDLTKAAMDGVAASNGRSDHAGKAIQDDDAASKEGNTSSHGRPNHSSDTVTATEGEEDKTPATKLGHKEDEASLVDQPNTELGERVDTRSPAPEGDLTKYLPPGGRTSYRM